MLTNLSPAKLHVNVQVALDDNSSCGVWTFLAILTLADFIRITKTMHSPKPCRVFAATNSKQPVSQIPAKEILDPLQTLRAKTQVLDCAGLVLVEGIQLAARYVLFRKVRIFGVDMMLTHNVAVLMCNKFMHMYNAEMYMQTVVSALMSPETNEWISTYMLYIYANMAYMLVVSKCDP